jgi:hypothetical protein
MNVESDLKLLHTATTKLLEKHDAPILKQVEFVILTGPGIYQTVLDVFCPLSVHPIEVMHCSQPGKENLDELLRIRTMDALWMMRGLCADEIKKLGGKVDDE